MNILFLMNHYPDSRNGGIETVTRILSEQFYKNGHVVHIRYLFDSNYAHSDDSIFNSCEQIKETEFAQQISSTVELYNVHIVINQSIFWATPIIKKAIEGLECKLVTAYHNKPTLSPPSVKEIICSSDTSLIKKTLILFTYPLFAFRSRRRLMRLHQKSYMASDYTILLSKQYVPEYSAMMQIDTRKLFVLNNPIRDSLILKPQELENKDNTILMVTRLDEKQKCIIKALKVWQRISQNFQNWKFQIVGSGPDELKIKKYAREKAIKNVEFYPAQNPETFYRKSSIFLMTSRNEGWPNTLNEAMRLGCVPVVIDTFSAVKDIIDNELNGIIIQHDSEPKDIVNCVNAISKLINDDKLLGKMAIDACTKTERLSERFIAKQWIELFENILSK